MEANLVQIDSILEDFFIASIIHSSSNQYWVDATRNRTSAPSLAYTWSDGTEVKKYLWISYEPNETGDCVRYYNAAGDTRNRLGDNPCTHNYSYICEKLAESPSTGSLGPFTEITNTSMCSLLRPTPSRSRVECGRVCLLTPECDGIVYQNNSCQLLRLAVINAVCDPYSVIPDSVYRLNRCGGEIGVNAIAG
ncbi:uncharacterized protein LOC135466395 [Liolophura sinensis]|uniref:uncharacterized protein LOC135466395 n=1 Tax=Liolophura sinensis TaxID=3198878 RepID=UPI0031585F5F